MSNLLLPKAKQRMLELLIAAGTVKAQLLNGYTYNAAHANLSDIPSGVRAGAPKAITSLTTLNGILDGDDPTWSGLSGFPGAQSLALYVDTGVEATSTYFLFIDTAPGLPVASGAGSGAVVFNSAIAAL